MDGRHTDREYEAELHALRESVLLMSATVENLLTSAMQALREKNPAKAAAAAGTDEQVDRLEVEIDDACLRILARRQPVAKDLRFITTTLKLVTDLERIGDLATNICERVSEFTGEPAPQGFADVEKMGALAQEMLRESLDAFVKNDVVRARSVKGRDGLVDQLYADVFPHAIRHMNKHPDQCDAGLRMLSIAKYIERIADHATNVSEMVIFMIEGHDVRHLKVAKHSP